MKVEFDVRFDHPVSEVFPSFAEPEKWREYIPALVERARIDDGPIRPGSRWRSVDRVGPVRVEFNDELVELEANHRVLWKQSAPWNSQAEYRALADGEATVVHVHFEGSPTGKIWWLRLFPDSLTTRVYLNDMKTLSRVLAERGR